ncbi:hypothetical protein, partial [Novosphingobium sp. Rr 2-17]|uniref:hypothetical protein n=1 Tax=Novosphingobium sp. Rr 2-17 TaxID=555793 RepID=UPI001ED8D19D
EAVQVGPNEDAAVGGALAWGDYGREKAMSETAYFGAAGVFDTIAILRAPYIFGPNTALIEKGGSGVASRPVQSSRSPATAAQKFN